MFGQTVSPSPAMSQPVPRTAESPGLMTYLTPGVITTIVVLGGAWFILTRGGRTRVKLSRR